MTKSFDMIACVPWAIEPAWLPLIADIAQRRGDVLAIEARRPSYTDESGRVIARDGVAILDLFGPVFPRANMLTEMSGATSLEKFVIALTDAVEDPAVSAILLHVDSPGGVAAGIGEAAEMIRDANAVKPVVAYVSGNGASAAYWLAAAAGKVYAHETAQVGSIGVVMAGAVQEAPDRDGYRHFEIVSSNAPDKRPDMATDDGVAHVRARLDVLEGAFVGAVARYRNTSTSTVTERFGRGGMLAGAEALARGMIDGLSTFEKVLAGLAGTNTAPRGGLIAAKEHDMSATDGHLAADKKPDITIDTIRTSHPDIAKALAAEGATAERERIIGIEGLAMPGHEKLVAELKADGKTSPAEAALKILAAEKATGARLLADRATDEQSLPAVPAAPATDGGGKPAIPADAPIEDRARAEWDASARTRDEFAGNYDRYLALRKAESAGTVRRLASKTAA